VVSFKELTVSISPELRQFGVKVKIAIFANANIVNRVTALENHMKEIIGGIKEIDVSENLILEAYRELHTISKVKGFLPPAKSLIELIKKNNRLPNINSVVDAYNIVSAETFLSIGAHDLDKIKGDLIFKFAEGNEFYIPLGEDEPQKVNKGEYVCADSEKVICWLDIKQCEQTKIIKETKNYLIYIQGNKNTSDGYLNNALKNVIENQVKLCKARLVRII